MERSISRRWIPLLGKNSELKALIDWNLGPGWKRQLITHLFSAVIICRHRLIRTDEGKAGDNDGPITSMKARQSRQGEYGSRHEEIHALHQYEAQDEWYSRGTAEVHST
jgi:hypothetical protein